MAKTDFLLILSTVLLNSAASLMVKKGASAIVGGARLTSLNTFLPMLKPAINFYTLSGLIVLGLSFIMFVIVVSRVKISIAQPMLAMTYVFVPVGAYFLFNERISLNNIIGIIIIILGVYVTSGGVK